MIKSHIALGVAAAIALVACNSDVDPMTERAVLAAIDEQMVEAANARDLEGWLAHVADDAHMMPPNEDVIAGKAAIREFAQGMLGLPGFALSHQPANSVVVAESGDLAYVTYEYEVSFSDEGGERISEMGKDLSVFAKQSDGTWKLSVDIWSPNSSH